MPPKRSKKRSSDGDNDNQLSTACFDVGGTPYKVTRSLLEQHPDTMLTRMASETWQSNPEESLFVERDGERFRYVLDYMRDGQVSVPGGQGGVTRTSLLNELTYFGFADVDPGTITVEFAHLEAPKYLSWVTDEYKQKLETLTRQRDEKNVEIACTIVAHACCVRYMTTGNQNVEFETATVNGAIGPARTLKPNYASTALDFEVIAVASEVGLGESNGALNDALSHYGLRMSNYQQTVGYISKNGAREPVICKVQMTLSTIK